MSSCSFYTTAHVFSNASIDFLKKECVTYISVTFEGWVASLR